MKNVLLFFGVAALFLTSCGSEGSGGAGKPVVLKTQMDSISYAIGQNWGKSFRGTKEDTDGVVEFNLDAVFMGILDETNGKGKFDEALAREMVREITPIVNRAKSKKDAIVAEKSLADGIAFLAENGKKEGVITTESGLQYKVTKEGTGPSPTADDRVKVHYHGTLIDGTVFDSSVEKGNPGEFTLRGGVIPGWTEGIPTMKIGGKTTFYIPSNLAYGPRRRSIIPGNSVLIFDVELLEIVAPNSGNK